MTMPRSLGRAADTLLDRSVLGGYTRIGYLLRRPGWDSDDPRPGALVGRTAVVTGANSGLGKAACTGLARLGATVHLMVRDQQRGRAAVEDIRREVPQARLHLHRCDVSDPASVRAAARHLVGRLDRLDVVVHNAGALPPTREESVDGHEMTLATHVLGPVRLTELLRPALSPGARVVFVSSGGMYTQSLPVDDPEYTESAYRGAVAYARSKRMQVALAPLMQQRWGADGVTVHVMHPGWADTPGFGASLPAFYRLTRPLLRSVEVGADTVIWLVATEPAPAGGRFWHDRAPRPKHYLPATRESAEDRARLWRQVLAAVGLDDTPG